jgi:hypothetical protein
MCISDDGRWAFMPVDEGVLMVDLQEPPRCYADFNLDGVVNTRDVLAFLGRWAARHTTADCDYNHRIDTADITCFLNIWTGGCD